MFNGDTAAGRAQWVPWLRSLELELDEWAWAVLQADVPSHGEVARIMQKTPASRTAEEDAELKTLIEAAAKGRDARQSKKSIALCASPARAPMYVNNKQYIQITHVLH